MESLSLLTSYALVGLAVGLIVGLTGVGGGSLMTPILTGPFGIPPAIAVGTDLVFASITKGVGTAVHGLKRTVQWHAVGWLLAGSLIAALAALAWLHAHGAADPALASFIRKSVGVSVLLTALVLVFRGRLLEWIRARPQWQLAGRRRDMALFAAGLLLGALVTVSSIGAGALGASILFWLHPHWEPAEVAGTDIAYAVPLTAVAGAGHFALGTVDLFLLGGLLIGSVPAIALGSAIARRLPERLSRSLLAVVLTAAGTKMVF
jgi:uncharacterized protein